jgi:TMEM175 potassium channel family protein
VETSRLETFADGVFAIAATLLVLEIAVPHVTDGQSLGQALLDLWPSYLAYATSFITIGIMWVNHHTVFRQIREVDLRFTYLNLGLLLLIAFVPFPTTLLADHAWGAEGRDAALAYGITLTITAVFFNAIWRYAIWNRRLLRADADPREVSGITRAYRPGIPLYASATLVAFVSPKASAALYLAIAFFYMISSSFFGQDEAFET